MLNNIVDNIDYNVGNKTLFNAVFNNPEQVVRFLLCTVKKDSFNLAILLLNIYLNCGIYSLYLQLFTSCSL